MKIFTWLYYVLKERKELLAEVARLKDQVSLKQVQINRTNSYWKGRIRHLLELW